MLVRPTSQRLHAHVMNLKPALTLGSISNRRRQDDRIIDQPPGKAGASRFDSATVTQGDVHPKVLTCVAHPGRASASLAESSWFKSSRGRKPETPGPFLGRLLILS